MYTFYTTLKVKAEMDQFMEGKEVLGIMSSVRKSPNLCRPLFVCRETELTKGEEVHMF